MDRNKRSSVSRIKFEPDDVMVMLPRRIKMEPNIDDESTLQLYTEQDNASDVIQSTIPQDIIEITDDEDATVDYDAAVDKDATVAEDATVDKDATVDDDATLDGYPHAGPSHETPQHSRPPQEPSHKPPRFSRIPQKRTHRYTPLRRLSRPKVYRVRIVYQNSETQTEIQMKDVATTTDDFESYLNTNIAKSQQVTNEKTTENDVSTERINGDNISDRNNEINNAESHKNRINDKDITEENGTNTTTNGATVLENTDKNRSQSNANTIKENQGESNNKKKSMVGKYYYRCKICSCYYAYNKAFKKHVQTNHKKKKVILDPPVTFEPKCKFCKCKNDIDHYNAHIRIKHKQMYNKSRKIPSKHDNSIVNIPETPLTSKSINKTDKKTAKTKLTMPISKKVIPKSVLFKCTKCSIHFTNCKIAVNHTSKCEKGLDDNQTIVSCQYCQRNFYTQAIRDHYNQHKHTDVFATHVIHDGISDKLLYKCSSCLICFNENGFKFHRKSCSKSYPKKDCSVCYLKIAEECLSEHVRRHELLKFVKTNFIMVEILE